MRFRTIEGMTVVVALAGMPRMDRSRARRNALSAFNPIPLCGSHPEDYRCRI